MFQFKVLLLVLLVVVCSNVKAKDNRIVGGTDAVISDYPHQVSVRLNGAHFCGGSIINSRTVLTAAHCIYKSVPADNYAVQYGLARRGGKQNVIKASRIVTHQSYSSDYLDYDAALIFLKDRIPLGPNSTYVKLARWDPEPGSVAIVTGWGAIYENGPMTHDLQQAEVLIVSREECNRQYSTQITKRMLCAGVPEGGADSCQGDSGGPLIVDGALVGIVSFGVGCARPNFPGVYTNLPALAEWVTQTVQTEYEARPSMPNMTTFLPN